MLVNLQHRGPDETRVRSVNEVSVGACRLSIVDPDFGSQPVVVGCQGTDYVVALNGEIYNFRELRTRLGSTHLLHGGSDTEVLAHLFEERGIECLRELNGMFGMCLSDGTTTYLVRDRFGVKPLYYRFEGDTLLFASEARTLVSHPIDLALETTYPDFETTLGYQTPFRGVLELPPGHYLKFDGRTGQAMLHRYYTLDDWPIEPMTDDKAALAFRELVEDVVRLRTTTNLEYGCYVSGGLDSSIIACMAKANVLLSAVVTDRGYMNERLYLDILCRHLGSDCRIVRPAPETFAEILMDLVHALDFPVTSLAAFTQYLLSREAARSGLRIVLGGLGVDEYLGGYTRHAALVARHERQTLTAQFPEYAPLFAKLGPGNKSEWSAYYALINRAGRPSVGGMAAIEHLFRSQRSTLNRLAATDMAISLPPLLRIDDRINMRFSIESRSPFLDYRVVEFAHRLPDTLKIRRSADGYLSTKYVLRRAFADLLPAQITGRRDKVGFPSPVGVWLDDPLKPLVERARHVVDEVPQLAEYFATEGVHAGNEFSRTSWQLVQWAAWCLLFMHGLKPEDATAELFFCRQPLALPA
jgi:asparagine synthase (glutamine-hydrolysing)